MMLRPFVLALVAVCATAVATPTPASAQASFDCKTARTAVEKEICGDKGLAALDRKMAAAYAAALKRLDPETAKLLREDQRTAIATRDAFFDHDDFDLAEFMEGLTGFLGSIEGKPRAGFVGTWANFRGMVTVRPGSSGFEVVISVSDGAVGRWICDLEVKGRVEAGALVLDDPEPMEGWRVRLTRSGLGLKVEAEAPAGSDGAPPFCGANGSVEGLFLAVKDAE